MSSAFQHAYYTWIPAGLGHVGANGIANFAVDFAFRIDTLSCTMLLIVTWIGFLIHVYATGYMAHEEGYTRFFTYLNLFMFMMLLLVLGANYMVMFVGWEGVGLCSYLLIGFYYDKNFAADAGKKAFVANRIGDFGFILGIFLIFNTFGTADYGKVFALASANPAAYAGIATTICLLLFVGACGKSAQIPLYVWLPDAMAGPTPVSALIHAATMVTAGVYMVVRSNVLFRLSPDAMLVVAIVGAVTAIFAATIGIAQNDIKKVLAYSTVSQLGFMFLAAGVGAFTAAIFHVMTHAFFKACLFLGAGSVIHGCGGEQDMRKMGGLRKYMPKTRMTMLIACIAIAGFPPLAGFFSKDEILATTFEHHGFLYFLGMVAATCTAFYMFRLYFMTFSGDYRAAHVEGHPESEPEHAGHDVIPSHRASRRRRRALRQSARASRRVARSARIAVEHDRRAVDPGDPRGHRRLRRTSRRCSAARIRRSSSAGSRRFCCRSAASTSNFAEASRLQEALLILSSVAVATLGWFIAYVLYKKDSAFARATRLAAALRVPAPPAGEQVLRRRVLQLRLRRRHARLQPRAVVVRRAHHRRHRQRRPPPHRDPLRPRLEPRSTTTSSTAR